MRFRPCIDIHNGKVKQIVGGSLKDQGDQAAENFVAEQDAAWYASLYKEKKLSGGHVILLNPASSPYYETTKAQAMKALAAWPGGFQIGGGIHDENAEEFLRAGASQVIVTVVRVVLFSVAVVLLLPQPTRAAADTTRSAVRILFFSCFIYCLLLSLIFSSTESIGWGTHFYALSRKSV